MLQQKPRDAQIFSYSFNDKMEPWSRSYTKLTMPLILPAQVEKKGANRLIFLANPLILLVRQEGFEPPTYGLEVRCCA